MISQKVSCIVTPAKAGVHPAKGGVEITGFRLSPRNDGKTYFSTFYETINIVILS
jgi:hypothetical protein